VGGTGPRTDIAQPLSDAHRYRHDAAAIHGSWSDRGHSNELFYIFARRCERRKMCALCDNFASDAKPLTGESSLSVGTRTRVGASSSAVPCFE
jgi:hypothetical protein